LFPLLHLFRNLPLKEEERELEHNPTLVAQAPKHLRQAVCLPMADVHAGNYKAILATFLAEPAAACLTSVEIQTSLDNAGDGFLQAFMFLGPGHQTLTIHTVTHYPIVPGVATQWDGLHFGFLGDIVGLLAQPIKFPAATAFDLTPTAVCIPTVTTMETHWAAVPANQYLTPWQQGTQTWNWYKLARPLFCHLDV